MTTALPLLLPAQLTFDDEFNDFVWSPSGSSGWMTQYPYTGQAARALPANGEAEFDSDPSVGANPFSVANGVLSITATPTTPSAATDGQSYVSGMISSYDSLDQLYGTFEVRAKLPAGDGLWSAFWMLQHAPTSLTELDDFEVLGDAPTTAYSNVHWLDNGQHAGLKQTYSIPDSSDGFHTYAVDWEPTKLTFYVDGVELAQTATPPTMNVAMYMILNLEVGKAWSWAGAPDSTTQFPASMQIDWVRAYASANTVDVTGTAAILSASMSGQVLFAGAGWGGVTVALVNALGAVIATTLTDTGGTFNFVKLAAGSYQLRYTAPYGMTLTTGSLTSVVTLGDGQSLAMPAQTLAGPANPATITGRVQFFGSATFPTPGVGVAGATVSLLDGAGAIVATAISDASGDVAFQQLPPGTYQLLYAPLPGQTILPGGPETAPAGLTAPFTLLAGQSEAAPIGEMIALASIAGLVGPAGSGVTVTLLNASAVVVAVTTTSAAGAFQFANLAAGTYQIRYSPPAGLYLQTGSAANSGSGLTPLIAVATGQVVSLPTELLLTAPAIVTGTVGHFGAATDPVYGTGEAGVTVSLLNAGGGVIATTTTRSNGWYAFGQLAAGLYQVGYTAPPGQMIRPGPSVDPASGLTTPVTAVAGAMVTAPTCALVSAASISGQVLFDNGSGEVLGQAGDAVALVGAGGAVLATDVTDAAGDFTFINLPDGAYQAQYAAPVGEILSASGPANPVTGLTRPITILAGVNTGPGAEILDASTATLSGSVLENGGAGPGVVVTLVSAATGAPIATATSDINGDFSFTGLTSGVYQLKYSVPKGLFPQIGGPDNPATGETAPLALAAGQTVSLAPESLLSDPASIVGTVAHFGGVTDPVWGGGDLDVTVSLLDMSGNLLASTLTAANGWYIFRDIGAGSYQIRYTAPAGQAIAAGTGVNQATGLTAPVLVGPAAGQSVTAPAGDMVSAITMTGSGGTYSAANGGYVVTGTASSATLTLGDGNQSVTLTGSNDTVVTGNGNQQISLTGSGNTISIGTGTSTIFAGSGMAVVHAAGGRVSITATGAGNLFDGGTGISFLDADGSAGNIFLLNAGGSGLMTTVTGFNPAVSDVLDLRRTLAGTDILANLSNLGDYVTSAISGANTVLSVTPTGGVRQAFAVIDDVHTTVAQMLAGGNFSIL